MTWLNVLVDPIVLQHQERDDAVVVSHPDLALEKNDLSEPGAHLVFGVHRRRDFANRCRSRAQPHPGEATIAIV
jgi:hypothetical protein